jgi:hypothetical protein
MTIKWQRCWKCLAGGVLTVRSNDDRRSTTNNSIILRKSAPVRFTGELKPPEPILSTDDLETAARKYGDMIGAVDQREYLSRLRRRLDDLDDVIDVEPADDIIIDAGLSAQPKAKKEEKAA